MTDGRPDPTTGGGLVSDAPPPTHSCYCQILGRPAGFLFIEITKHSRKVRNEEDRINLLNKLVQEKRMPVEVADFREKKRSWVSVQSFCTELLRT
jgi:hypothetical protein